MSRIGKSRKKIDLWLPGVRRGCAEARWRETDKGYNASFWSDTNILKLIVVMIAELCEYIKSMNCRL